MGKIISQHNERSNPRSKYWGGAGVQGYSYTDASGKEHNVSAEEAQAEAARNERARADKAIQTSGTAADRASAALGTNAALTDARFKDANRKLDDFDYGNQQTANLASKDADARLADYSSDRRGVLGNAQALEQAARNAGQNYQQTADRQFVANQDANTRRVLALGATGGAGGLRTALATSSVANAQAANQAELIRAQEMNQIQAAKENAIAQAAGIRSGVAGQDQGAAQLQAQRSQAAWGNRFAGQAQRSQNIAQAAATSQAAGQAQLGASVGMRGQDLTYKTDMENAALNAEREYEDRRLKKQKSNYTRWVDPLGIVT